MIQWHEWGSGCQSHDGRFEIDEVCPGQWRPVDTRHIDRGPVADLEAAKGWCEMRLQTPADDFDRVQPDVVVETVDGQTVILPANEAPEF